MGGDKIMKIMLWSNSDMIFELFGNGNDVEQAAGLLIAAVGQWLACLNSDPGLVCYLRYVGSEVSMKEPFPLAPGAHTRVSVSRGDLASPLIGPRWPGLASDWLTRLTPQHQLDTSAEMTDELGASGSAWLITTNVCFIMFYPHTAALKIFYGPRFIINLANIFERIEHILWIH